MVEDDEAVGTVLELVLKIAGHQVEIVGDLSSACRSLETKPYDLVLLDLQLPDGHGFDVLRHLRLQLGRQTPVIVLSSARAEESRPVSLQLGVKVSIDIDGDPRVGELLPTAADQVGRLFIIQFFRSDNFGCVCH